MKEGLVVELPSCRAAEALKEMPKYIRDKRERESRKRQKERPKHCLSIAYSLLMASVA